MIARLARARVFPVIILALIVLAMLKAANLWIGFAGAEAAEEAPAAEIVPPAEAAAPDVAPSETERRILEQLAGRRTALEALEEAIGTREKLLEVAERRLDQRFTELAAKEAAIATLTAERDRQKTAEFEALSSAYERMKPKDAARIFEVLEDDILVPVAAGMRTQALSGVLAEMNPEKAKALTRLLAAQGRIAKAGETAPLAAPQ